MAKKNKNRPQGPQASTTPLTQRQVIDNKVKAAEDRLAIARLKAKQWSDELAAADTALARLIQLRKDLPADTPVARIQRDTNTTVTAKGYSIIKRNENKGKGVEKWRKWHDLPTTLKSMIISYKPYPWLRVDRAACSIAGPIIYRREEAIGGFGTHEYYGDPFLGNLIFGLEHDKPTPTAPFGRDLKMSFLKGVNNVFIEAMESYDMFRSYKRNKPHKHLDKISLTNLLADLPPKLNILPNLQSLCYHDGLRETEGPPTANEKDLALVLARRCTPKYFCWFNQYQLSHLDNWGYNHHDIQFGNGHSPETVGHHFCMPSTFIMVCYGSLNRVDSMPEDDGGFGGLDVRQRADWVIKQLKLSDPEMDSGVWGTLSEEELTRRDKMTWESCQIGDSGELDSEHEDDEERTSEGGEDIARQVAELVWETLPLMKARVRVHFKGDDLEICKGCYRDPRQPPPGF